MKVEAVLREVPLRDVPAVAGKLDAAGVDVIADVETRRDPLLTLMAAAPAVSRAELATAITVAFPRTPMVLAVQARMLADHTGGRFRLGLGTQVRRHVEDRFGAQWSSPGPRMRDYVRALQAIWASWADGGELAHQGPFFQHTLMTPGYVPDSDHAHIPVDLAAVNPYNLRTAATLCDGVRLHSFCTRAYAAEVTLPVLRDAAEGAGRTMADVRVYGGGFVATGADTGELRAAREYVRYRVAYYGATKAYLPVLAQHGLEELGHELRAMARAGRWAEMAARVDDDVLALFCASGTYDRIAGAVAERFAGIVDVIQLPAPPPGTDWEGLRRAVAAIAEI
ncbi:TIGR03617 family F420-dependent LLM class oxidoreductase [Pseudonocardia sp. MH-G8]|uniref:TIGR03617 family F420-dependent LLM class oxidoreductase n=1 Tax=Pseudonocardia sp. MH-G8 TaxID=1854588 RepID=UPI000BA18AA7|nr:TIGR03617 family F420-dependent LLM class oxidoreductase [Pseudonocardia sp. MH-G8]OZM76868.1 LLM class F420-dependent oxidoreductase [Pseudonocardia sp. MH-G8]